MQFQVPQFIETEDKIIGPFTLRQFLYLAAGGGASFTLYFLVETWLWAFLSLFFVGGSIALAFIKVNGRTLPALLFSAFSFYWKPQTYVWRSEGREAKKEEAIRSLGLEDLVSGLLLKNAWRDLQTGTKTVSKEAVKKVRAAQERYQIFQRISGERQAARRIDYR